MKWMMLVVVMLAAACGGQEFAGHDAARSAEAKKIAPVATITATDGVYGGSMSVAFNPGQPYALLSIGILCYQGGALVLASSTIELNWAASNDPSILDASGTYHWTFAPLLSQAYTGGAADCTASGYGIDKPYDGTGPATKPLATAPFHISG